MNLEENLGKYSTYKLEDLYEDFVPENVHTKFWKYIIGANKYTTNITAKGETGRFPLAINALMLTIKYWLQLNDASNPSHCNKLSFLSLKDTERASDSFNMHMKSLLETLVFDHLWENKTTFFLRRTTCMTSLKNKLSERYTSYFKSVITEETKPKLDISQNLEHNYKLFKTSFKKENYLSLPLDKQNLFSFSRFRVSNHKLELELGRCKNILPEERYCRLCNLNQVEDEFYFIMSCSIYSEHREQLFQ